MLIAAVAIVFSLHAPPKHYTGIGNYHRPVTTQSVEAQAYFDQGLAFLYGFNKEAACDAFKEAARLDPDCAMAYWGIAMADGPDINAPTIGSESEKEATESLAKAKQAHASEVERQLVNAAILRYQSPPPNDQSPLYQNYASKMREVWHNFPTDPDVGAAFAESMMDLHPWAQWHRDGTPEEGTLEIIDTIRAVLKVSPDNPLALHMYIHAAEAGPHPEWAEPSADRLLNLLPGVSHMVHMPSHTYVRIGRWQDAIDSNAAAIKANLTGAGLSDPYGRHNQEMLAYAAMMIGQRKLAVDAVDKMFTSLRQGKLEAVDRANDGYTPMTLEVRVRFGLWDEILAIPESSQPWPLGRAVRHYARGIAFAAKGNLPDALAEQKAFEAAAPAAGTGQVGRSSGITIVEICRHMLAGEIALAQDHNDQAVQELTLAVKAEDNLGYDEPPDWIMPTRHALGAVLVKAKRYKEAEAVYRADLANLPHNGWALYGLSKSLQAQGQTAASKASLAEFKRVWAKSDTPIVSSCMCVR